MVLFTKAQISEHNTATSAWIIIDGKVYDITKFAAIHPGGTLLLLEFAGKDVTEQFYQFHRTEVLEKYKRLCIGEISIVENVPVQVPFAEPSHLQGFYSPYYKYIRLISKSHLEFRQKVRAFIRGELFKDLKLDDSNPPASIQVYKRMGETGFLASNLGPGPHLNGFDIFGVKPKDFDYFHELIVHEELGSVGQPGYRESLGAGMKIGLPPILHFGSPEMKERVVQPVLRGEKRICLAISEPGAGSDVTGIQTTAVKTPCGKFYIVNGVKKWITNGTFSDYFTTAVRTGKGKTDISVLLIERSEGLETRSIKTSHNVATGTAYVIFENVKVPVANLLGKENQGFKVILYNFNHERWIIIVAIIAATRYVIEECFKWAHQRIVFGKRLIDQPTVRNKLAHMVAQLESIHSWLENLTYQMNNMTFEEQSRKLAGPLALLKLATTRVSLYVKDQSVQIFGGRALTQTGMGRVIESFMRTQKFGAILGGSEEIMADLGIKQAMKQFPNTKL